MIILHHSGSALSQASSLASSPVVRIPIRVLKMKIPLNVTMSMLARNPGLPWSPPMVPGSIVRMRLIQRSAGKPSPSGAVPVNMTMREKNTISMTERIPSHIIKPAVPLDIMVSKA